ncbi:MAG: DUF3368 domain-containing protein [Thermoprotei archaeon]|nr:MAG: DUF3368 domain-containing protein [Thermoprotei archaeon]
MTYGLVVSNSSVLIHLTKISRLDLLYKLFKRVVIPLAVYRECTVDGKPGSESIKKASWINVLSIKNTALKQSLMYFLDEGESEVIVLALEINADLVLLDESEARRIAKNFGLNVTGTIGILLKAKKKGYIENLSKELNKLKASGFWIDNKLIEKILKETKESYN